MASKSSEFVLDEGLDDDEDILAFHTNRLAQPQPDSQDATLDTDESAATETNTASPTPSASEAASEAASQAPRQSSDPPTEPLLDSIIIDGLPLTASRADLNSLLPSPEAITHIRLRRLEAHGLLRVMVEFSSTEHTSDALLLDGTDFRGSALSIKVGTPERWAATAPRRNQQPQASIWSSLGAMAERLEASARKIGEELETKLHVSERVAETAAAIKEADSTYGVSEKVGEMARAGRQTAKGVDQAYGISDGVGRVVGGVGSAAIVVAQEVDESFRVGDRAREAANAVMKSETFGPVARGLVQSGSGSKKNYQPSADVPEEEQVAENGVITEAGSVGEDGRVVEGGNRAELGE